MRLYHNNFIAVESGDLQPNTNIGHSDGDALKTYDGLRPGGGHDRRDLFAQWRISRSVLLGHRKRWLHGRYHHELR